ncbi:hypothetical protein Fleli_2159 [Bernardetia litoralis DSM 6794]|uniref:DUF4419 domain-containing protein n=1 Tax=Bernardetia litoralis (strain ATCC 23117 / DSM 6794 / NBRC 15988 / NCIMB 1366 / Fx l1 / Sio-4) TaxID=880071 RepID=I4AKQ4_BERLS|nr:DUF4419 domain-containing protein [Bernardetia litoralis]AFM04539.1 hypothetical protein Fleli_2159 [Bernardetia litoralis DSM 6794]
MKQKASITFEVEKLKRAKKPLKETSFEQISKQFSEETIIGSADGKEFVSFGTHSFLKGMQVAYAEHRPFVLSPDMIWLLICQGFSKHVEVNAEKLRHLFVDFEGKKELIIENDNLLNLDKTILKAEWKKSIDEMNGEVAKHVGEDLINNLTADFSTTSLTEKIVSQITVLNAFQPYFDYTFETYACGIPQITLEGTIEDWQKVIDKSKKLAVYELDWWISELIPILEEIKETAKGGVINTEFWMNMFKQHTLEEYGSPTILDGWIIRFFPYYQSGYKKDLFEMGLSGIDDLPPQIVNVPFIHRIIGGIEPIGDIPKEFLAGFFGLEQNPTDLSLRPIIEWSIIPKRKFISNLPKGLEDADLVYKNITEFPTELLALEEISHLELFFNREVKLPQELSKKLIFYIKIEGEIKDENYIKDCLEGTLRGQINKVSFENTELRTVVKAESKKLRAEWEKEQEEKRKKTFLYKLKNLFN